MNQRFASNLSFAGTVLAATLAAAVMSGQARAEGLQYRGVGEGWSDFHVVTNVE